MDRAMEYEGADLKVEKSLFPEVLQVGKAVSDGQDELELHMPVGKGVFYFADGDLITFFKEQLELLIARTVSSMSEDMLWITMVDYSSECTFRIIHDGLKPNTSFIKTSGELEPFLAEMNELVMERDRRLGEVHDDLRSFNMTAEKRYPYHLVILNMTTLTLDPQSEKAWLQMGRLFERVGVVVYGIGPSDQREPDPHRARFIEQFTKEMLQISRTADSLVVKNGGVKSSELYEGYRFRFVEVDFEESIGMMTRTSYGEMIKPKADRRHEIQIALTEGDSIRWRISEDCPGHVIIGGNRRTGKTNLLDCLSVELNAVAQTGAIIVRRLNALSGWDYLFEGGFLNDLKMREAAGMHESVDHSHTVLLVDDPKAVYDALSVRSKRIFELLMMSYLPIMHSLGYTMVMVIGSHGEPWIPMSVLGWVQNRITFRLDSDSPSAIYFPDREPEMEQFEVDFREKGAEGTSRVRGHVLLADVPRVI